MRGRPGREQFHGQNFTVSKLNERLWGRGPLLRINVRGQTIFKKEEIGTKNLSLNDNIMCPLGRQGAN